jgi:hypothetical protein
MNTGEGRAALVAKFDVGSYQCFHLVGRFERDEAGWREGGGGYAC